MSNPPLSSSHSNHREHSSPDSSNHTRIISSSTLQFQNPLTMRSSTALFQAVLFALASASPRPENALVARADDLSPEVAQLVADNGATAGCYSSTSPPPIPAKLRKRQDELAQESCPAQDLSVCKRGFIPLCCLPELFVVNGPPVGLIESGCSLRSLYQISSHSCN